MATCPNKNTKDWDRLVSAQNTEMAYYLWDKYLGEVPEYYYTSLDEKLINGFLKDFNIDVKEYEDLKEDLGFDSYTAADLIAKAIVYEKGQSITPEVAYFAYSMLGRQNNKIRSELRYLIGKWDKFSDRFEHHKKIIQNKYGYIKEKGDWLQKVRDNVILDFLKESIEEQYYNPQDFQKSLDTKWTKEDFTLWNKIIKAIENFLSNFSDKFKKNEEELQELGRSIADEVLNQNYEYYNYNLKEDQIRKYYKETIESDSFAKQLVEFGQSIGMVLTGSLALRRAGEVYRTATETLHDIDWVVPYNLNFQNKNVLNDIKNYQGNDKNAAAKMALPYIENFEWFKKFKEEYPSYQIINGFYGNEHNSFESLTVQGVVNGEFYELDGTHEEEIKYYSKDEVTKKPIQLKKKIEIKHKKGDWIKDSGYVIDFFIRLEPKQEEHENYFKLWKEIMIAKLQMGRDKDFIDWKAFVPYLKSKDSFNFNYEGFRHFNYESNQKYLLDETKEELITKEELDNLPNCV